MKIFEIIKFYKKSDNSNFQTTAIQFNKTIKTLCYKDPSLITFT